MCVRARVHLRVCARVHLRVCARACVSPFRHPSLLDWEFHFIVLLSVHDAAASHSCSTFRFFVFRENMIISLYSRADVVESQTVFLPRFASMGKKCFKVSVDFS